MHSIASGSAAAVGLVGSASEPIMESVPDSPSFLATPAEPVAEITAETPRRLVVRLLGGEELELGDFEDRGDAVEAAQELVARFSSAETAGVWPEVGGRFLRPASIASVDVLVKD
jgi:hypothetical protein